MVINKIEVLVIKITEISWNNKFLLQEKPKHVIFYLTFKEGLSLLMKKLTMLLILVLSFSQAFAGNKKISYKQCIKLSNSINSSYPMVINRDVTVNSSYCSGISSTPSLHYIYHTAFTELVSGEEKRLRNAYCTSEKTKTLLRILDTVYLHYFAPNGTEFAVISINEKHCRWF